MFSLLERLILFFVVISFVRVALQYVLRLWRGMNPGDSQTSGNRKAPNPPLSATLHQDPVCGTYVAAESSLKRVVAGKVVHFCSAECRDQYTA